MRILLISIIIIFFTTMLFVSFILDQEEKNETSQGFWSRLWMTPFLSFLILIPVMLGTLFYFLFVKGTSIYFDRLLSFQDNSTIVTTSLWIIVSLFLCEYLFHPLMKEIIYFITKKNQEQISSLAIILFDSFIIYLILNLVPGVTVNGYVIAFILSLGLFILDSFIEKGASLLGKRSKKGIKNEGH